MNNLGVGFRFHPTEEELVSYYLREKLKGTTPDIDRVIPVVDIYNYNPWELPQLAGERCHGDTEQWFFFIPRQEREARGGRPNRLTKEGYWKATGSPGEVYSSQNQRIGRKKTMVFYEGRAPHGRKTSWKMNEYKVFDNYDHEHAGADPQVREELSLCRIYKRSKCSRAFDRRPPTEVAAGNEEAVHHHRNHADEAINPPEIINGGVDSPSSGDQNTNPSPSSGDQNTNPSQSVESENNWDMATDNEPMWDWEEFYSFTMWDI
ncbi:hypothetical protein CDL12_21969 [Handroanthus impetiginosus]|uniref:NAC domain-containing protein n=1 Tax=Handroanthus impetiginosus TaxID=429701 RepID=A0A2G9GJQ8_9LAMI|nr:hypothetical protein CDL12_21969 [Handroanthus impetiginosus]